MEYNDDFLKQQCFTETGIKRFKKTLDEFGKELFEKSIYFGKTNKEKNMPLEITNDNVREATIKINHAQKRHKLHPLLIIGNVFEYVFTILATIGVSNLDKDYGKILFGVCTGIAVILITIRLIHGR